jgi:pSer/pThr/pTyr-binding forkhead associated (FHA) protein
LGSPNGSYVGDTRITESHPLRHGVLIRIGDRSWTFEVLETPRV